MAAVLAAPLPAWAADTAGAGAGPWLFGCLALGVALAAGYAVGVQRTARRLEAQARRARSEQRQALELIDGWHWQTDAAHVLRRLHAPPAQAARTPPAAAGHPLWECFDAVNAAGGAGLRARVESGSSFIGVRARAADGSLWLLRGVACHDDGGGFAGHAGVAQPLAEDDAGQLGRAAFAALMQFDAGAAMLVEHAGGGRGWRVVEANAAAADLLGARAGEAVADGACRPLPAAVLRLLEPADRAAGEPDGGRDDEGWRVAPLARPEGAARAALAWRPAAPAPGATVEPGDSEAFSYTVSHDLRAPIRVVEGFTRIVKEDYGRLLDRVGNDHLDRVLGAAARMNQMIDAMLALARLSSQPLAQQPVNLSQLAGYVVDDLRRHAPERQAEVTIEPGLQATGDPTLLRLVLENLLGNAWKYSARTPRARIDFGAETIEGRRVFVVRDNGAGFDMRSADRLFGLFQRLHSQGDFPGTGLGLASTRRIVRRHGGDIWAQSQAGHGATFYFTLGR